MTADDVAWAKQLGPAYRMTKVAELLGRPEREVMTDATLLRLDAPSGEPQYPVFQFATDQRREAIGMAVDILADAVATPWTIASWLTSPQPDLNDRTPLRAIDDGDTATVLGKARRWAVALRR